MNKISLGIIGEGVCVAIFVVIIIVVFFFAGIATGILES